VQSPGYRSPGRHLRSYGQPGHLSTGALGADAPGQFRQQGAAMNAIDTILDEIIRREGGYVNHPADRGGPTNFGITAQTLGSWRKLGRPATAAEVQALKEPEARAIYRQQYIT